MKLATCTTMVFTDGTNSTFAVMRGPMGKKYFKAHKATVVALYTRTSTGNAGALAAIETEMTARHATVDAPAVYWQGGAK
jgi:hypothetical protein